VTDNSVSTQFRELLASYYQAWFRYHPEAAVDAGVPGYERLLTPFLPEPRAAVVCLNDQLIVSLDELDRAALTPDETLDCDVVRAAAFLQNQQILWSERRSPDPERMLPLNAIHQLTLRDVPDAAGAFTARLQAVPEHLQAAQAHLERVGASVPWLWATSAVTAARAGVALLEALPQHPALADPPPAFSGALTQAVGVLQAFAGFLESDLVPQARGNVACGRAYFEQLLHDRHFLDVTPDDLYRLGQQLVEQARRDLADACRAVTGRPELRTALKRLSAGHPPAENLLDAYRDAMQAARQFVIDRGLVTLPPREQLEVIETPAFLRHQIPFAAYNEPSSRDRAQRGYYYVTPPADAAQLAEHGGAGIAHTCVHEAWPGHHLQFVTANSKPESRSLPRLLNPSATMYEGWALYCEQLMHEQGFLASAEQRVILLRDRLWRALRILIDVGLHTRGMTVDQAAELLVENLGFPRSHAIADVTWYTRSPTVPLGYATGWALINALRDRERLHTPAFSLPAFHDRLLSVGSVALPLVIRRGFGDQVWRDVRRQLFSA
jgi:uncharacterized protein (DUF885 family)